MRACLQTAAASLVMTIVAVGHGGTAEASGINTPIVGSPWSGVARPGPASVFYNPANLSVMDPGLELQLSAALLLAFPSYERDRRARYQFEDGFDFKTPVAPSQLDPAKTGRAERVDADVILPVGSAFVSWSPVLSDVSFGFGVYPGQGAALAAPADGAQRYHLHDAFILGLYITPSIAWEPFPDVHIGAGVSAVYGITNLSLTLDLGATELLGDAFAKPPLSQPNDFGEHAPPGVRELDVLSRPTAIETSALGATFNVGVSWTPGRWILSASYQHSTDLTFEGDATLDMNDDFFTGDLEDKGLKYPSIVRGDAFLELPLPKQLRFGVAWTDRHALTLSASLAWMLWSETESLKVTVRSEDLAQPELGVGPVAKVNLPRNYNDSIEVDLQAELNLADTLVVGMRVGYQSPFSPDDTIDLSSIDGHRLVGRLMLDLPMSEVFTLTGYAGLQYILPREVKASDFDRGNGTYNLLIVSVGGALNFDFD